MREESFPCALAEDLVSKCPRSCGRRMRSSVAGAIAGLLFAAGRFGRIGSLRQSPLAEIGGLIPGVGVQGALIAERGDIVGEIVVVPSVLWFLLRRRKSGKQPREARRKGRPSGVGLLVHGLEHKTTARRG